MSSHPQKAQEVAVTRLSLTSTKARLWGHLISQGAGEPVPWIGQGGEQADKPLGKERTGAANQEN